MCVCVCGKRRAMGGSSEEMLQHKNDKNKNTGVIKEKNAHIFLRCERITSPTSVESVKKKKKNLNEVLQSIKGMMNNSIDLN